MCTCAAYCSVSSYSLLNTTISNLFQFQPQNSSKAIFPFFCHCTWEMIVFDCFLHSFTRSIDNSRLFSPICRMQSPRDGISSFFGTGSGRNIPLMNSKSLFGRSTCLSVRPSSQSRIIIILPPPLVRHIWGEPKQDERSKKEEEEEEGKIAKLKKNCKRLKKGSFSTALDHFYVFNGHGNNYVANARLLSTLSPLAASFHLLASSPIPLPCHKIPLPPPPLLPSSLAPKSQDDATYRTLP